jgi:hypothetical protein
MKDETRFPHVIDCYRLVAREGQPPHPENVPVAAIVVNSEQEVEEAKRKLLTEHPGGWCIQRPLD